MKGQFFIISTVIMISALILITNYLYDYGLTDLTRVEQMQELNYIADIQNSIRSTKEISCYKGTDVVLQNNMILTENDIRESLMDKGIEFDITTDLTTASCSMSSVQFTMESSEFEIQNTFSL